uniref:Uncharacterized protein n=1 Tax=Globodera pallida TaxID=36090 RepID=A0A183CJJ5_GLOPA
MRQELRCLTDISWGQLVPSSAPSTIAELTNIGRRLERRQIGSDTPASAPNDGDADPSAESSIPISVGPPDEHNEPGVLRFTPILAGHMARARRRLVVSETVHQARQHEQESQRRQAIEIAYQEHFRQQLQQQERQRQLNAQQQQMEELEVVHEQILHAEANEEEAQRPQRIRMQLREESA